MTPIPRGYADPLEWFEACHDRIRRYVGGLGLIVDLGDLADPRVPPAAAAAARYLREGLPLHGRDEDESLAPRLRRAAPDVGPALDQLAADHARMDADLPALLADLAALAAGAPVDAQAFASRVAAFAGLMHSHLALEETTVFPAMAALPPEERAALLAEMHARRS